MTDAAVPGPVDPAAVAAEVRRALLASGLDPTNPDVRNGVLMALDRVGDRRLAAAEKQQLAYEAKVHGASYRDIVKLGLYKSPGAAQKAVQAFVARLAVDSAEEARAIAVERLEGILSGGLYRKARGGDLKAIDRVLKLMREERRYIPGLEVPLNAEVTGAGGGAIIVELNIPAPEAVDPVPEHQLGAGRPPIVTTAHEDLPTP